MGRKSKLQPGQWEDIARRLARGEKLSSLSKEFGVSPSTISERLRNRVETVKTVANQMVSAEEALRRLSVADQISAISLADELRSISMHMAGAGKYSAATAHRLAAVANAKLQTVSDSVFPEGDDVAKLQMIASMTKMANDAAYIPLGLLAANKETVIKLNTDPPKTNTLPAKGLSTAALREIVAARKALPQQ